MLRVGRLLLFALPLLVLLGCASPWQRHYSPDPAVVDQQFPPRRQAQVRLVEPERLDAYFANRRERQAESDIAYEDWDEEQLRQEDMLFLRALRLRESVDEIVLLGSSSFVLERRLDPRDGALARFAARTGADYAVASVKYLGTEERITTYPATSYSNITIRRRVPTRNGYRYVTDYGRESATTWVPMRITVDRHLHTAYFLRRVDADDD